MRAEGELGGLVLGHEPHGGSAVSNREESVIRALVGKLSLGAEGDPWAVAPTCLDLALG